MAQSTQNIAKSIVPKKRRKQRFRVCFVAFIFIFAIAILCALASKLFRQSDAENIPPDKVFDQVLSDSDSMELPVIEPAISITISAVGDCTLGTDENFNYSRSLNAYFEQNGAAYFEKCKEYF